MLHYDDFVSFLFFFFHLLPYFIQLHVKTTTIITTKSDEIHLTYSTFLCNNKSYLIKLNLKSKLEKMRERKEKCVFFSATKSCKRKFSLNESCVLHCFPSCTLNAFLFLRIFPILKNSQNFVPSNIVHYSIFNLMLLQSFLTIYFFFFADIICFRIHMVYLSTQCYF